MSKCFKSRYGLFEGSSNSGGFSDKCDASAANNVLGFAKDLFIRVVTTVMMTVSADLILNTVKGRQRLGHQPEQRWWSPVPAATPVGALHPQLLPNICGSRAQFAQFGQFAQVAQTHFYCAFRYGDQDGTVHCGDLWHRGAHASLPMLIHIPNHFIAPSVSSSRCCPQILSAPCVSSIFSAPIGSTRASPLFSAPHAGDPFSEQQRTPHSVAQTPILDLIVGPMTIQTMKAWNSFSC